MKVLALLKEFKMLEHRQIGLSGGEMLVRILLDAKQSFSKHKVRR